MQTKHLQKRKWVKRIVVLAALFLTFAVWVVLGSLNFSHQDHPSLWRLQRSFATSKPAPVDLPSIIGHRGSGLDGTISKTGKALSPTSQPLLIGNTVSAIRLGVKDCEWIEVDLQATLDQEIVLFHDNFINLKTDYQEKAPTMIGELPRKTLEQIHLQVDPPEKIPTLAQVFDTFHSNDTKWVLDIKDDSLANTLLPWLQDKVDSGLLSKDSVVIQGTYPILQNYRGTGFLLSLHVNSDYIYRRWVAFNRNAIIDRAVALECSFIVLPILYANDTLIRKAHQKGLKVWVFGSNDVQDHWDLARRGVDGLIVDHPKEAIQNFER